MIFVRWIRVLAPAVTKLRPAGTIGSGDTLLPPGRGRGPGIGPAGRCNARGRRPGRGCGRSA
ncbi:hypothetical protein HBB16_03495 [Pseudonocardia sp. MCCB 268]|nr:hypothetical protein [Pseudonocardia cytotoxica]